MAIIKNGSLFSLYVFFPFFFSPNTIPLHTADVLVKKKKINIYVKRKERKENKKQNKSNRATPKRGNPSLELGYLMNPPLGNTLSNRLSNCSPTTPSSLLISVPQGQKSSPTLIMPLFYSWQSMLVTSGQYA